MRIQPCAKFRLHQDQASWWLDLGHSRQVTPSPSVQWCSSMREGPLVYEVVDAANKLLVAKAQVLAPLLRHAKLEGKPFAFLDYGLVMKRSHADSAVAVEFWLCGLQWGPIACWWETPKSQSVRQVLPPTAQVLQAMNRMLRAARDNKWTDETRVDVTMR